MPRIPDAELERLKTEVSLERLVEGRGIVLKPRGADRLGLCPFHEDREPSLVVTPAKNLWHCFGCGLGGGVIDWVMKMDGVSFRHAVALLKEGLPGLTAIATSAGLDPSAPSPPVKRATARKLDSPVSLDADDQALLDQVIDYYHATLKRSPDALSYLAERGIDSPEAVETFKLGYADRTLGLRLPEKNRKAGAELRGRLVKLGLYRESGHEHFNGSLIVPVFDEDGHVVEVYGRKRRDDLRPGTPKHLYLPGPHRGVWNEVALQASSEIILCEALIDALTFWVAGFRNVTASYGVQGFTEDHRAAFQQYGIKRVLIAYDRDAAGDRAADVLAARLMESGIECYRLRFPHGLDANAYARQSASPHESLGALIRSAEWLGKGQRPVSLPVNEGDPGPASGISAETVAESPTETAPLAASVVPPAPIPTPTVTADGEDLHLTLGDRRYRARGLAADAPTGVFKLNLLARRGDGFHADSLDLYSARQRNSFAEAASVELNVSAEVLRRDLGRLLLALEAVQDERRASGKAASSANATTGGEGRTLPPPLTGAERDAALSFLQAPDLLDRITEDLARCGLVGEPINGLVGYLACLSRKLPAPLAVLVQSASAAGKSALQDACLAFVPEHERVKYSAVTGQSLFYVGETDLQHKVLAIAESEGALQAAYALKLLQSEGELTIASTAKDPQTGQLATRTYRVKGPVMLLLTTTAAEPDEELLNRCLVLAVNESRRQTQAIHAQQRQRRTLEGLLAGQEREAILQLHRNAQRLLEAIPIVNPYAERLTFVDGSTRTRRDHEKYLTLIDALALLHQHQRPHKTARRSESGSRSGDGPPLRYLEATLDDIETANRLAHEVLGRTLDELPPQTRRLLRLTQQWVNDETHRQSIPRRAFRFRRRELREALGWGDTQLKIHLARLVDLEYVLAHRAPGQSFAYELLYDGPDEHPDDRPHLSGLIDVSELRRQAGEPVTKETADTPERAVNLDSNRPEHAYDAGRSGLEEDRSAPGRPGVGPRSGGGRRPEIAGLAPAQAAFQPARAEIAENAKGRENPDLWPVVAYSPVVPAATTAATTAAFAPILCAPQATSAP